MKGTCSTPNCFRDRKQAYDFCSQDCKLEVTSFVDDLPLDGSVRAVKLYPLDEEREKWRLRVLDYNGVWFEINFKGVRGVLLKGQV